MAARVLLAGVVAAALAGACARSTSPPVPRFAPDSAAETEAESRFEFRRVVMAVEARIVLHARDAAHARAAATAAFDALDRIDALASDWSATSELAALNAAAGQPPVPVSSELGELLTLAQQIAELSGGAFDPTVGPAVALWRTARRDGVLPEADVLERARALVTHRELVLQRDTAGGPRAALRRAGMSLDLGGIAKGWALDSALAAATAAGAPRTLVELGGDLRVGAPPPGQPGWRVQAGSGESDGPPREWLLTHAALATSGDVSQHLLLDGVRYSHVVDPRSARALTDRLSVTVAVSEGAVPWPLLLPTATPEQLARLADAASRFPGALADALASAARVLGPRAGRALALGAGAEVHCEDPELPALFDGRTLAGWTTRGGRHDGDALWSVEDGCLVGRTGPGDAGGLLYFERPFSGVHLSFDVQLDAPFDSGLFLRMAKTGRGLQVTLDDRPEGEIGSLYADGWLLRTPQEQRPWRSGAWNHVEVLCTGFDAVLDVWINGVHWLSHVDRQSHDEVGQPRVAPAGMLGLQVHGGGSEAPGARARFRDIRARALPVLSEDPRAGRVHAAPRAIVAGHAPAAADWQDLLVARPDGTPAVWDAVDGEGGPRAPHDIRIVDGVLEIPSAPPSGYLATHDDWRDFVLSADVALARLANGGLFLRGRRQAPSPGARAVPVGNPAFSGCEIQLIDEANWAAGTGTPLADWQTMGSLYGAVAPGHAGLPAPVGEWNRIEVLYLGSRLAVALGGVILYDVDTLRLESEPPFAERAASGFLGLQRYASPATESEVAVRVRALRAARL